MLDIPTRIPEPVLPAVPDVEAGPRDPAGRAVLEAAHAERRKIRDAYLAKVHEQSWRLLDEHPERVATASGFLKIILELHAPEPHWGGREVTEPHHLYYVPECKGCEQGGNSCGCSPDQPDWPCATYWAALDWLTAEAS